MTTETREIIKNGLTIDLTGCDWECETEGKDIATCLLRAYNLVFTGQAETATVCTYDRGMPEAYIATLKLSDDGGVLIDLQDWTAP